MRRRPIHPTAALSIIALAALVFALPEPAHAQSIFSVEGLTTAIGRLFSWPLEILILPLSAAVLYLAGYLMDAAIQFSLHTAYLFSLSPAINLGWVIVRDIANIFFIFILIWISLGTIVNGTRFGTMNMLKNVVIAALLINFSLFFTKALVDVSNIFGNWLYGGVQKTLVANSQTPTNPTSLSGLIATRLGIIQFWLGNAKDNANGTGANPAALTDPSKGYIAAMLRLAVVVIAIYIFMYVAVLFIARSITILFLMVFSPIGFMGGLLPQISPYSKKWWKELSSAAIFPTAFLLMLYISLQFINSLQDIDFSAIKGDGVAGFEQSVSLYFQYFLIIFLLKASLKIAKENSGDVGSALGGMASSLGKLAVGAVTTYATGGAMMGLRALGRGAGAAVGTIGTGEGIKGAGKKFASTFKENMPPSAALNYVKGLKDSKQKAAKVGTDVRDAIAGKMKSGTWDVRNIGVGDNKAGSIITNVVTGATGEKGIDFKGKEAKDIKTETAEWTETRKVMEANNKIQKHLEELAMEENRSLATFGSLSLKQLRDRANAPGATAAHKNEYVTALKQFNDSTAVKDARKGISDATSKLGNKQLEKLDKKALKNEEFIRTISQSQVEHLADKAESDEDKAKIWGNRLGNVTQFLKHGASADDLKKVVKGHSDEELKNLPADALTNPALINPDAMDFDKFDKLVKSKNVTNSTKDKMREIRYEGIHRAIQNRSVGQIEAQLKKLEAPEIAKLGWEKKDANGNVLYPVLANPEVIYRLDTKTLKKIYEELNPTQLATIKSTITDPAVGHYTNQDKGEFTATLGTLTPEAKKRVEAAAKFFVKDQIGQEF